jgi:UDPglucose 6-dehydrogenase
VIVTDPQAVDNARAARPELSFAADAVEACRDADVVLLLTEWQEFRDLDPVALREVVAHPRVLDGRNALDPLAWRAAGWTYRSLGRH